MRLAFAGTPEISTIPLHALVRAGHEIALVVTQADKRRGRGNVQTPAPVKRVATELTLPVSHTLEDLVGLDVDYVVVAAFGKLIPARILDAHTFINIHPSLLPRWRGAAPVDHTILAGDEHTGVCLMRLVEQMDAGPLYRVAKTDVGQHEHASELLPRLFELGSQLLVKALAEGLGEPVAQVGTPTFASKFEVDGTRLRWEKPALELDRIVRIDRAWARFREKRLRILDSRVVERQLAPGEAIGTVVGTGDQSLELLSVQPEGRQVMTGEEWINGTRIQPGERLG